jgi:hypothetical protein
LQLFGVGRGCSQYGARDAGPRFEGKSLTEQYALGDLHIDGDLPDSDVHVFSSEHGFLGMFPMGNKRFRLIASNPISKPSKDTEPSIEELQRLYDQRSPIPAKFHDMSWSSWFHINSRMIHQLRSGRIFLGGDSAHIHSPAGAQGMNTGIQDMIDLSWKLAMVLKGEAKEEILDTYATDRVPVIRNVLTKTEGLTKAIGEENPIFRSVFNHLAPWFVGTDFVQHNSTERMSQLSLNYRESALSVSHSRLWEPEGRRPASRSSGGRPQQGGVDRSAAGNIFHLPIDGPIRVDPFLQQHLRAIQDSRADQQRPRCVAPPHARSSDCRRQRYRWKSIQRSLRRGIFHFTGAPRRLHRFRRQ